VTSRLRLDNYVYEDVYPAFKATTDEKQITAKISRTFLNYLLERKHTLTGEAPAAVADIGCGPCDTLIMYLTGVAFAPGFTARATDFLPAYADSERGEALRILAAAQANKTLKLEGFAARAGNAFGGNLLDLLSGPNDGAKMRRAFRIVFASHVIYHAEGPADVQRMLADVANNLLAPDGVCIMFHIANRPGTFQEFRGRFGSEASAKRESNTGAVTIDDPVAQIGTACAALHLPLYEMDFATNLRFGKLSESDWRAFKDPQAYDVLAESNPAAYQDLMRLYFVVQRAPLEFAADRSAMGLATFIDETRRVIEANGGVLASIERMQVMTRADAAPLLRQVIPAALAACGPNSSN
jgi:hypothetical protein